MTSIQGPGFYAAQRHCTQSASTPTFGAKGSKKKNTPQAEEPPAGVTKNLSNWFSGLFNRSSSQNENSSTQTTRKVELKVGRGITRTLAKMAPISPRAIVEWIALFHGVGIIFPIKHFLEGLTGYNSIIIPRINPISRIATQHVGRNKSIPHYHTLLWNGLLRRDLFKKTDPS